MIRFIIKSAFWLSLAFIVIPRMSAETPEGTQPQRSEVPPPTPMVAQTDKTPANETRDQEKTSETVDQILTTGRTALEIGKFCVDNPSLCEGGKTLFANAGSEMIGYIGGYFKPAQKPQATAPEVKPIATEPDKAPITQDRVQHSSPAIPVPTSREEALRAIKRVSLRSTPAQR